MLKITDKPQYEDYENTKEVMDMFKHAIHSDFALEWISGALAHLDVQRTHNKALHQTISMWFDDKEGKEDFIRLFKSVDELMFLVEMRDRITKESETDDV